MEVEQVLYLELLVLFNKALKVNIHLLRIYF